MNGVAMLAFCIILYSRAFQNRSYDAQRETEYDTQIIILNAKVSVLFRNGYSC